jgi:hypothetical protein
VSDEQEIPSFLDRALPPVRAGLVLGLFWASLVAHAVLWRNGMRLGAGLGDARTEIVLYAAMAASGLLSARALQGGARVGGIVAAASTPALGLIWASIAGVLSMLGPC